MREGSTGWTPVLYARFRVLFGLYLLVHFAQLLPWAAELFSHGGMLPDGAVSPILHAFPNVLALYDAPWFVYGLVLVGLPLSMLLIVGVRDRVAALGLWFVWACLFGRNPLIANPSIPYVGLLLLTHAALPTSHDPAWRLPASFHRVIWIVMAVGYSYSGITKLVSPS